MNYFQSFSDEEVKGLSDFKELSDLFKIAWFVSGKARIRCSDNQKTSQSSSTIFIHPFNKYLLRTHMMALQSVKLDRLNYISQNSLPYVSFQGRPQGGFLEKQENSKNNAAIWSFTQFIADLLIQLIAMQQQQLGQQLLHLTLDPPLSSLTLDQILYSTIQGSTKEAEPVMYAHRYI